MSKKNKPNSVIKWKFPALIKGAIVQPLVDYLGLSLVSPKEKYIVTDCTAFEPQYFLVVVCDQSGYAIHKIFTWDERHWKIVGYVPANIMK